MKVTILSATLIGVLVWDYAVSAPGHSTAERFYRVVDTAFLEPAAVSLGQRARKMEPAVENRVRNAGRSLLSFDAAHAATDPQAETASADPAKTPLPEPAVPDVVPAPRPSKTAAPHKAATAQQVAAAQPAQDLSALLAPAGGQPFAGRCVQAANAKPSLINSAITAAGLQTNASLNYLVHVAILESRLRTYAPASSSSAAGLFQFTKQTWLAMLKRHGSSNGLGHYADAIEKRANRWVVAEPGEADAIYSLRQDPTVSAAMAAELAKENAAILQQALGREPSDGELYAAHFLGPEGAVKLVAAKGKTPSRDSDALFPAAAKANPWMFRDSVGKDRSVSELYAVLTRQPSASEIAWFCKEGYQQQVAAKS